MAVLGVYSGDWPDYPSERVALLNITKALVPLDEWFILFVRLRIPEDGQPDLVIFKPRGIFIVELKHCEAPIFGGINGPWLLKEPDGTIIRQLNEGQERNPYQQVDWHWHSFRDFFSKNARKVLPLEKTGSSPYLRSALVICPDIPPGSEIKTDWKVPCMGLSSLPDFLWSEGRQGFSLEPKEIKELARLLNLRYWRDVEALIRAIPEQSMVNWHPYVRNAESEIDKAVLCYVPQEVKFQDNKRGMLSEVIEEEPRLLVIGPAGIGKSTQLKYCQKLLGEQWHRNPKLIPLPIDFGLYDKDRGGFEELIRLSLSERGVDVAPEVMERLIKLNAFAFLIDGLTEVPPPQHDVALRELRRWFIEYPQCRYILTARSGEGMNLPNFVAVELQPFSERDLQSFFTKRLKGQSPDLSTLNPHLRELLKIPFFAEAFAKLSEHGLAFTQISLTELVAKFVEAMLEHEMKKAKEVLTPSFRHELELLLADIAAYMQKTMVLFVRRDQFRSRVRLSWEQLYQEGRVSLPEEVVLQAAFDNPLVITSKYAVRFLHQLIQEFLAGLWLARLFQKEPKKAHRYLAEPWWTEPVVFAIGYRGAEFLSKVVQANNLWAVGRCLQGEAGEEAQKNCRSEIEFLLLQGEEERLKATQFLTKATKDPYAVHKLLEIITEEENRLRKEGKGTKAEPSLAVETKVQQEASHPFRTFGIHCQEELIDALLNLEKLSPSARRCVLHSLRPFFMWKTSTESPKYSSEKILDAFEDLLKKEPDPSVRWAAASNLVDIARACLPDPPPRVVGLLRWALENDEWPVTQEALEGLNSIGELELDSQWFSSQVNRYLEEAEQALAGGDLRIASAIAGNYYDEILGQVLWEVVKRLGKEKYEALLLRSLPSLALHQKVDVINHLGLFGSDISIEALEEQLLCSPSYGEPKGVYSSWACRWSAVNALVQIGTPVAEEALSRCLARMDTRWDVALLGALGLLIFYLNRCGRYAPLDIPRVGEAVQYCWDKVGGTAVLEFLENLIGVGFASGLSAKLMKDSPELTSSRGIIGLLLHLIPGPKLRTSALELLEQDKHIEFMCNILSKVGRREDLPLLRSKLWNRSFHHMVQATVDRINEMLLADEFSE